MRQTDYTTRVLEADDGHKLTQAADVPDAERVVAAKVYLAANDTPEAWREITNAEAADIEARQAEAAEAERETETGGGSEETDGTGTGRP